MSINEYIQPKIQVRKYDYVLQLDESLQDSPGAIIIAVDEAFQNVPYSIWSFNPEIRLSMNLDLDGEPLADGKMAVIVSWTA